jgi:hypothetical protein
VSGKTTTSGNPTAAEVPNPKSQANSNIKDSKIQKQCRLAPEEREQ